MPIMPERHPAIAAARRLIRSFRSSLSRDDGITFVEVVVTLIMLMAAVVVIMYSLYAGQRSLDSDMHRQQALRIVQEEMEYWIGRMYLSTPENPSFEEMLPKYRYKSVPLDDHEEEPGPTIVIYLSRSEIQPVNDIEHTNEQGDPVIGYYRFTVWAEWTEPDGQKFSRQDGTAVSLSTYVAVQM